MTGGPGVLITRPARPAAETAEAVAALGFAPILAPALEMRRLDRVTPQDVSGRALAFTSAEAVLAAAEDVRGGPAEPPAAVYCVGDKTAEAARAAGFDAAKAGPGDGARLAEMMLSDLHAAGAAAPVLVVRGRDVAFDLAGALRAGGMEVAERALYAADPVARLPAPARSALTAGAVAAALFFSARTVAAFLSIAPPQRLKRFPAICNSARTAAAAGEGPLCAFSETLIAREPTLSAVLEVLRATISARR
ncbi:MAG: uroporphyrinogen-III synthase [Pseudomonadota bacterium]